jgi:N-acetylglucosamine transport system substrate-binding protein
VKPLISNSTYNFFTMFDQGVLPLLGDYKPLPKGTKVNRDDTWWNNHVTKVMNGQETVDAWLADIEAAYVQVQADYSKEQK